MWQELSCRIQRSTTSEFWDDESGRWKSRGSIAVQPRITGGLLEQPPKTESGVRAAGQGNAQPFGEESPVGRPKRVFDGDDVVTLRAQGLSYRQIAAKLSLGEGTVRRVIAALAT